MWNKPWKLKEGFIIGGGLVAIGLLLQWIAGPVAWSRFAFPVNVVALVVFVLLAVLAYAFRGKVHAFRFMGTQWAAVPALAYAVVLTIIMGLTKQLPDTGDVVAHHSVADVVGISRMLSFWPFVLVYVWMAFILALVTIHRLLHLHRGARQLLTRDLPFMLNHLGLLVAMLTATLGNADMQRLQMTISADQPEWRAVDSGNRIHELPIAIQLKKFHIDEYLPKLMLVNNLTGRPLGGAKPEMAQVETTGTTAHGEGAYKTIRLGDWLIEVKQFLDYAQPVMMDSAVCYEAWNSVGATSAVLVKAKKVGNLKNSAQASSAEEGVEREGWLSCGSYMYPYQMLTLDDNISLVMPDREPRRFISRVEIFTKSKKHVEADILVNKPFSFDGWKIYQSDYDTQLGRWSDISVLELVRDPWLPFVYAGIIMMLAGAVFLFIGGKPSKPRVSELDKEEERKEETL